MVSPPIQRSSGLLCQLLCHPPFLSPFSEPPVPGITTEDRAGLYQAESSEKKRKRRRLGRESTGMGWGRDYAKLEDLVSCIYLLCGHRESLYPSREFRGGRQGGAGGRLGSV
jgi:hypothetical protein